MQLATVTIGAVHVFIVRLVEKAPHVGVMASCDRSLGETAQRGRSLLYLCSYRIVLVCSGEMKMGRLYAYVLTNIFFFLFIVSTQSLCVGSSCTDKEN